MPSVWPIRIVRPSGEWARCESALRSTSGTGVPVGSEGASVQRRAKPSSQPVRTVRPSGGKRHGQNLARVMQGIAQGLPAGHLPEPRGPVLAAGHRQRTRSVQGYSQHLTLMLERAAEGGACAGVPESSRAVLTARDGDIPIAAQTHRPDRAVMTQAGAERPAAGGARDLAHSCLPDLHAPVVKIRGAVGGADEQLTRPVFSAPRVVRNGLADRPSRPEIPGPDRVVHLARCDGKLSVGPEAHLLDPALVAQRLAQGLLAGDVPELGGPVVAPGQDRAAVGAEGNGTNGPSVPQRVRPGSAAVRPARVEPSGPGWR